jgi:hypothetical protein
MKSIQRVINRGTGAGGAATNMNGKGFEAKTSNESRLLSKGFVHNLIPNCKGKHNYYLEHKEKGILYLTQGGLSSYFKHFLNKDIHRCPDEAYLVRHEDTYILKVLEKKHQNTAGSVDTKLWAGYTIRYEYQDCLGIPVQYAFCLSDYLKKRYISDDNPSFKSLRKFNEDNDIVILFGDDEDYYAKLDDWIGL